MKRLIATIGLVALTAALAACTGPGSSGLVPQGTQSQARHASDAGSPGAVGG